MGRSQYDKPFSERMGQRPNKTGYAYMLLKPTRVNAVVADWGIPTFQEALARIDRNPNAFVMLLIAPDDPDNPPEVKTLLEKTRFIRMPGTDQLLEPYLTGRFKEKEDDKGESNLTE